MRQESLKFKFKPVSKNNYLIGGIIYIVIGLVFQLFFDSNFNYFFLIYGLLFIVAHYYFQNLNYITIDDKGLKVKRFIPKRISWEDFEGIRFHVGEIKVLSRNKTININKEFLYDIDAEILEDELKARLPKKSSS